MFPPRGKSHGDDNKNPQAFKFNANADEAAHREEEDEQLPQRVETRQIKHN